MTAYNVLTMVLVDDLPTAVQSVKWLARQRNARGGFVSTQDTVVGLAALSLYSQRMASDPLNMVMDVKETKAKVTLTEKNKLLMQTKRLSMSNLPIRIDLTATGQGCAMVQTVLRSDNVTYPQWRRI